MHKLSLRFLVVPVILTHVPAVIGQSLVYTIPVPPSGPGFYTMAPVGDVNGDGRTDLIASGLGNGQNEFARVYSGANGQLLYDLHGAAPQILFGDAVCGLHDVNGDGHDEFVAAAPQETITAVGQGRVTVYSGIDGTVLFSSIGVLVADWLGNSVADVGDVDGDGKHDLAAGMTAFNGVNGHDCGGVRIISGADGSTIWERFGGQANEFFGGTIAAAGDVDHDGHPDLLVGAPGSSAVPGGYARLLSGLDGSVIHQWNGDSFDDQFGWSVAALGDVDGDQVPDFAVGSYGDDDNGSNAGSVRVFSGATYAALYTIHGSAANARLSRVSRGGDLDGDGLADVLISGDNEPAPNGGINNGLVRALHGTDGHEIISFYGVNNEHIGVPVLLGDVDLDGHPEIAFFGMGIEVHSILDCAVSNECVALPNSAGAGALMSQSGPRSITTNQFTLIASGTPPHAPGRFFFGQNPALVVFGNGFRCISAPFYRLPVTFATKGTLSYTLDFTHLPAGVSILAGSTWRFQAWFRDVQPGAAPYFFNLSDALAVTFCP